MGPKTKYYLGLSTFQGSSLFFSLSASVLSFCWFSGVNSPSANLSLHSRQARAKNSLLRPDALNLQKMYYYYFSCRQEKYWQSIIVLILEELPEYWLVDTVKTNKNISICLITFKVTVKRNKNKEGNFWRRKLILEKYL